jgi:hypothetical protein
LVALSGLYLWYFVSNLMYRRLDKKSVQGFLDSDKIFGFLKPYLIKFKLYNSPT